MENSAAPYRLLLNIWRDSADHAPIDQAAARIATRLGRATAADFMLLQRTDPALERLESVAIERIRPCVLPSRARMTLSAVEREAASAWFRSAEPIMWRAGREDTLSRVAFPFEGFQDAVAIPLVRGEVPLGVFTLAAKAPNAFTPADESLMGELMAPLSVALLNDSQSHEMARLREAFEADRRALLQRLGRDDLTEEVIGVDSGLRSVMERVEQVAPTDVPVLLLGETGSGKEVAARAIHARSRRRNGPIVRVNCGAIPAGLIDSELFGHERGSFTGAVTARKGWFERADGGTLFLDEVAELSLDAQVRLLRVLQDGTFERVGGHKTQSVDVRIIAATHRDVKALVARGAFREDLWYRVGVFPISIPPLRERPEDIPALASQFAARAGVRLAGAPLAIDPSDIELLVTYAWPGNVRELAAVIERAAILGDGRALRVSAALGRAAPEPSEASEVPDLLTGHAEPLLTLEQAAARHIEQALRLTNGRIEGPSGAAAKLGINPHTLRARMRKLRLDWAAFRGRT
ncbi:MAG: sigma 54-interacting transcriptional regulator [Gemmatimonadaceae bacterium]